MLTCCHWHCCPNKIQKWHLSQRQLRQGRNNHPSIACFTPLCTMQDLSETDILGPWQRWAGFQRDAAFAKLDVQETLNTCNEDITKLGSVKPQSMSKESNAGDLVAYEAISLSLKSALLTGRAKIRRAYRKDVQSADRNMCQRSNLAPCNKKYLYALVSFNECKKVLSAGMWSLGNVEALDSKFGTRRSRAQSNSVKSFWPVTSSQPMSNHQFSRKTAVAPSACCPPCLGRANVSGPPRCHHRTTWNKRSRWPKVKMGRLKKGRRKSERRGTF